MPDYVYDIEAEMMAELQGLRRDSRWVMVVNFLILVVLLVLGSLVFMMSSPDV